MVAFVPHMKLTGESKGAKLEKKVQTQEEMKVFSMSPSNQGTN